MTWDNRKHHYHKEVEELREKLKDFKENAFSIPFQKHIKDIEHIFDYLENIWSAKLNYQLKCGELTKQVWDLEKRIEELEKDQDA